MGLKLNLTAAEVKTAKGGTFQPLPEGTYGAVIYEAKFGESKSSGKPMYTITFKITEGIAGIGRQQRGYYVINTEHLWIINALLKATDFPVIDGEGEYEFPDADEFLGKEVNIRLKQEAYETEDRDTGEEVTAHRNNVAGVFPYDPDRISVEEEAGAAPSGGHFL